MSFQADVQSDCVKKVWENPQCSYAYSWNRNYRQCECVMLGNACEHTAELGTVIYSLDKPMDNSCEKAKEAEPGRLRRTIAKHFTKYSGNKRGYFGSELGLYTMIAVLGLCVGVFVTGFYEFSKDDSSLEEMLMEPTIDSSA